MLCLTMSGWERFPREVLHAWHGMQQRCGLLRLLPVAAVDTLELNQVEYPIRNCHVTTSTLASSMMS
jgi:hypothetical protein